VEVQNKAWQDIVKQESGIKHKKVHKIKHARPKHHKKNTDETKIPAEQQPTVALVPPELTIDLTAINTEITKLNEQIKTIVEKNAIMQTQLAQINTRVSFVEKSTHKLLRFDIAQLVKPLQKYTQADAVVASCVISSATLCLFIIIALLLQLFKKTVTKKTNEEYEVMSSKEDETTAKLNLARAYIDMGKNAEARTILNEVIASGNATQQAEAQDLLTKVPQD
jgi:FimV-like protein